jgi:hypothetical protein
MSQLDLLRDAYVNDRINLDEFERFVEQDVAGNIVALPMDCWPAHDSAALAPPTWVTSMLKSIWTDG